MPMLLKEKDLHIWQVELELLKSDTYKEQLLSADEQSRAAKFRFDEHRIKFISTRSMLRQLLGLYLEIDPATVTFSYLPNGKPFLQNSNCCFNVSHSGNMALIAFSRETIGIDIELEAEDKLSVAERFFSDSEFNQLKKLPLSARTSSFYEIWTKKEAALKALGIGLTYPLNSFSLDLNAKKQTMQLGEQPITIIDLKIASGYKAAVASFEQNPRLKYHAFAEKLTW